MLVSGQSVKFPLWLIWVRLKMKVGQDYFETGLMLRNSCLFSWPIKVIVYIREQKIDSKDSWNFLWIVYNIKINNGKFFILITCEKANLPISFLEVFFSFFWDNGQESFPSFSFYCIFPVCSSIIWHCIFYRAVTITGLVAVHHGPSLILITSHPFPLR